MAHVPVMTGRVVALLAPALTAPDSVLLDATVGLGGHAAALLRAAPEARLVGLDRDPAALAASRSALAGFGSRVTLVHAVYDRLAEVLADAGVPAVQAILFDLGVSSMQLDRAERGFSYAVDAPLDMRMDPGEPLSAADVVNGYSTGELARVLREFGEERFALRVARAIVRERERAPLTSTARLADLVRAAIPAAARRTGGHPAKRSFQALRIEVNAELRALSAALPLALAALAEGGRIVVLSYQSLEDRIVKRVIAAASTVDVPPGMPVLPEGSRPALRRLTRGAERPGDAEVQANPRAASAKLRAAEKLERAA